MAAEVTTLASTGSSGSLASVGNSLVGVGSASKAFVLTHPVTMAAAGGVLLGIGAYYTWNKMFKKQETVVPGVVPTPA